MSPVKFKRKIAKMGVNRVITIPRVFEGIIEPGMEFLVTLNQIRMKERNED
jgi:hypothetical protein